MQKIDTTLLIQALEPVRPGGVVELKAPQEIVHIKHKISLRQYKYWVLLLQELKVQFDAGEPPDEDGFYSVVIDRIAESLGYLPVKAELKADLSAIRKEPICFNYLGKDGQKEYYEAGFISEFKVTTKKIRFKFPSFLEKVMRGLEAPKAMFMLLNWEIFNHFTGKYEAIIYKLCKDYVSMTVEQFREYIGLKEGEYSKFEDLNKRCIRGAVSAVNSSEVSDILVYPEFSTVGRKIISLYFRVEHKKQTSLPFPELEENIFCIAKVPIPPALQTKYLAIRPKEEIILCIERANDYGTQQEKIGKEVNYGAVYARSITEGWHEDQAIRKSKAAIKKEKEEAALKAESEKNKIEKEKSTNAATDAKAILAIFWTWPVSDQREMRRLFADRLNGVPSMRKIWEKDFNEKERPEEGNNHYIGFAKFLKEGGHV
jgi:Initiator Replication protein